MMKKNADMLYTLSSHMKRRISKIDIFKYHKRSPKEVSALFLLSYARLVQYVLWQKAKKWSENVVKLSKHKWHENKDVGQVWGENRIHELLSLLTPVSPLIGSRNFYR